MRRVWTFGTHMIFPRCFRAAVLTVLLCARQPECLLAALPAEVLMMVLGGLDWRDWRCEETEQRQSSRRIRSLESSLDRVFRRGYSEDDDLPNDYSDDDDNDKDDEDYLE